MYPIKSEQLNLKRSCNFLNLNKERNLILKYLIINVEV
jgi:hypothetical protein